MKLAIGQLQALVAGALLRAGANATMAECTARALVLAEAQGLVLSLIHISEPTRPY